MTVNDEQWDKIADKYGGLMWKISHNISGDAAISSPEDNYADLQITALDAVTGFEKKTGKEFDEFWGDKLFDQYLKTCLWNMKNNKGAKIAKKYPITKNTVSIPDNMEILGISTEEITAAICGTGSAGNKAYNKNDSMSDPIFLQDIIYILSGPHKKLLSILVNNPYLIKHSGQINISALCKEVGESWATYYKVTHLLKEIGAVIQNKL